MELRPRGDGIIARGDNLSASVGRKRLRNLGEGDGNRMWPWKVRSAYITTIVLLVFLAGGTIAVSQLTDWPSDRLEPWVLLAATVIALIPLLLLTLDCVAERRGTISILKYLTVDFSQSASAAAKSARLTPNIVSASADLRDSGKEEMRSALVSATETDIVEIDLRTGDEWWTTRLLVLAAGAARLGRPGAISFLAQDGSNSRVFQGWAFPSDLLDQLLVRDVELRVAYWKAERDWTAAFSNPPNDQVWTTLPGAVNSPNLGISAGFLETLHPR